jgi:hypothetical protein
LRDEAKLGGEVLAHKRQGRARRETGPRTLALPAPWGRLNGGVFLAQALGGSFLGLQASASATHAEGPGHADEAK